jgi:outer membrane receptor protein involved in Fe transport
VGNPALSPEVAVSYEAGTDIRFAGNRGKLSGTFFYQDFRDLIQFDASVPGPLGFGQLRNKGRAFSRGVEAEAWFLFAPQVQAGITYTLSDTWDRQTGKSIIGIPGNRAMATLLITPVPSFQARLDCQVESGQEDAPLNGTATRRPGYTRVDAYAKYRWRIDGSMVREVALTGKIQNLLDRKYQERIEFPAPGFNFLLGAELKI